MGVTGYVRTPGGDDIEVKVSHVTAFSVFLEMAAPFAFGERVEVRFHGYAFEGVVAFRSEVPAGVVVVAEALVSKSQDLDDLSLPPSGEFPADPPIPRPRVTTRTVTGEYESIQRLWAEPNGS